MPGSGQSVADATLGKRVPDILLIEIVIQSADANAHARALVL